MIFFSCKSELKNHKAVYNPNLDISNKQIPYKLALDFYVKNGFNFNLIEKPYIDNQKLFNEIFGSVISKDNLQDNDLINFEQNIVIPIVLEQTNLSTTIKINRISLIENKLVVNYTVEYGDFISYIIQPSKILIINKKDLGDINDLKFSFKKVTKFLN